MSGFYMKNKILCLIIAVMLAFAGFPANANALERDIEAKVAIQKLSELSSDDRKNILTIVYPIVIIDTGIDTVINMIDSNSQSSQGVFGEALNQALEYATADELKLMLSALKIVPEDIRKTYLKAFTSREELKISVDNEARLSAFANIAYKKYSGLEKICTEDGITLGVVAKFLTVIPAVNDGMPIFYVDEGCTFSSGYISNKVSTKFSEILSGKVGDASVKSLVDSISQHFNQEYSKKERENLALLFEELGISSYVKKTVGSYKNIIVSENYLSFPAIYAYFSDGLMLFKAENVRKATDFTGFNDINGWYEDCITELAQMKIVAGRGNGSFCPNDFVTREEFVKMICASVNLPAIDTLAPFEDVVDNSWYDPYIRTAYHYKLINGTSNTTFGVGEYISRQDVAVICNNLLKNVNLKIVSSQKFDDASEIADYAVSGVTRLSEIGVINGDGTGKFNPRSNITRAESAKIINEIIYLLANIE